METEELKMIVEALSGLTDGAGSVAVWWVASQIATSAFTAIGVLGCVLIITRGCVYAFSQQMEVDRLVQEVALGAGVEINRRCDGYRNEDLRRLAKAVRARTTTGGA